MITSNPSGEQPFFRHDNSTLPFDDDVKTMPFNSQDSMDDEGATIPMGLQDTTPSPVMGFSEEEKTHPYTYENDSTVAAKNLGPVIGWLVVLSGPGRGNSMPLGYGRNSIGRGEDNEVSLPFGDKEISKQAHAYVAYDQRSRKCYAQFGNSRNLIYLNNTPLLSLAEMPERSILRLGQTELMYVPFCTKELDWKDIPENVE